MKKIFQVALIALTVIAALSLVSCGEEKFPEDDYYKAYETMLTEDYAQAGEQFEALTKKAGKYPEIWYNYGICLQEQGEYQKAVKALETAAKNYQNSEVYDAMNQEQFKIDCLVQIGEVFILQGEMEKAEEQFTKVLSTDRENQNLQVAILATYLRTGHVEEAIDFNNKNNLNLLDQ